MVGVAVGLAAQGYIPFASTFACFLTRASDQIRMAAISRSNVKCAARTPAFSIGEDGPSQMGARGPGDVPGAAGQRRALSRPTGSPPTPVCGSPRSIGVSSTSGRRGAKTPVLYAARRAVRGRRAEGRAVERARRDHDRRRRHHAARGVAAHDELADGGIAVRVSISTASSPSTPRRCWRPRGRPAAGSSSSRTTTPRAVWATPSARRSPARACACTTSRCARSPTAAGRASCWSVTGSAVASSSRPSAACSTRAPRRAPPRSPFRYHRRLRRGGGGGGRRRGCAVRESR